MGISVTNSYKDFQSNYRVNEIPRVNPDDVKAREAQKTPENLVPVKIEEPVADNRKRSIDPNEVSLTFNKNDDFSNIGSTKDIQTLDIRQAISDMKQDSLFQEYQYFVGSASNVFQSEDGKVLAKL